MIEKAQKKTDNEKTKQKPLTKAQHPHPAAIFRKAQLNPDSLSRHDVLQLQRISNKTTEQFLTEIKKPEQDAPAEISQPDTLYNGVIEVAKTYNELITGSNNWGERLAKLNELIGRILGWKKWADGPGKNSIITGRRDYLDKILQLTIEQNREARQKGKELAYQTHLKDRAQLLEYLNQYKKEGAKSDDPWIRNSSKFIDKIVFFALTPTGDSYARVMIKELNPNVYTAYFPAGIPEAGGDIRSAPVSYNADDLEDNTNVLIREKEGLGWSRSNLERSAVMIVSPSSCSRYQIFETIKHELRHIANSSPERYNFAGLRQAAEDFDKLGISLEDVINFADPNSREATITKVLEYRRTDRSEVLNALTTAQEKFIIAGTEAALLNYKEEYRTLKQVGFYYPSLNNQNKPPDGITGAGESSIFEYIRSRSLNVSNAWKANFPLADGTPFRNAIKEFTDPTIEGFNEPGYFGVYCFLKDLDAVGEKEPRTEIEKQMEIDAAPVKAPIGDSTDPQVQTLLETTKSLKPEEAAYIIREKGKAEKTVWANKLEKHLAGLALKTIYNALRTQAKGSK